MILETNSFHSIRWGQRRLTIDIAQFFERSAIDRLVFGRVIALKFKSVILIKSCVNSSSTVACLVLVQSLIGDRVDAQLENEVASVHTPESVHDGQVGACRARQSKICAVKEENKNGWNHDKHEVDSKPSQVDGGIRDEIL